MLFETEKILLKSYYSNILYHNTYKIQDYDYIIHNIKLMPDFLFNSYFMFSSIRSRTLILKLLSFTSYRVQYKHKVETMYFISDDSEHNIKMFNKLFSESSEDYFIENSILHMLYNKSETVLDDMVYYFKNISPPDSTRSKNYIRLFNRFVDCYENIHDTTKLTEIVNYLTG